MSIKCTMYINWSSGGSDANQPDEGQGWSESFNHNGSMATAITAFEALCDLRAQLLARKTAVVAQRYQPTNPVGNSILRRRVSPSTTGLIQDNPSQSLVTRVLTNIDNFDREVALRGTPDPRIEGGVYNAEATYNTALQNYFSALGNGFGMDVQNPVSPRATIASIDDEGLMTLDATLAVGVGDYLILKNVKNTLGKSVSGTYRISALGTDAKHFVLGGWGGTVVDRKGIAIVPGIVFRSLAVLNNPAFLVRSRKVGRPFGQRRGRASKRS